VHHVVVAMVNIMQKNIAYYDVIVFVNFTNDVKMCAEQKPLKTMPCNEEVIS
jgi:hypothetical protein